MRALRYALIWSLLGSVASTSLLRQSSRLMLALFLCQQLISIPSMAGDGCLDISNSDNLIALSGTLQEVTATSEDFDPESFYVLRLDKDICTSGDEFSDPASDFHEVHLYANQANVQDKLENLLGARVEIRGVGFGAHTRHHYRPLVVEVKTVSRSE